ncbi:MAG: hypothetical protein V1684_03145 [bacterium]
MRFHFKICWLFKYNIILIILIALIITGSLAFFLYRNFYQTIAQTEAIIILQNEVGLENIDTALFEQIRKMNENKKAGYPKFLTPSETKWLDLKNPFLPY